METDTYDGNGGWSYDHATNTLTMYLEESYTENGVEESDVENFDFQVEPKNS